MAFIVSHPIQYYVPLYQRLSSRDDLTIKVFYTWHDGSRAVLDRGFGQPVAWDISLTEGYEFELIENTSTDPGTHHFFGLRNPSLVRRVLEWEPTIAHVTGWAWASHLKAMSAFNVAGIPTLFRGDSHLLDRQPSGPRWWAKQLALRYVYRWPQTFLVTGKANEAYYRTFGVSAQKFMICPHSIDSQRFSSPDAVHEEEARRWRRELGISDEKIVFLFAGKFEARKDPVGFMRSVMGLENVVAIMVGGGELQSEVDQIAKAQPHQFRILPFQNQTRMPVVYRLGDLFVLPSLWGETWGLAVNEALACGRPVLVSDKVGCAPEVVDNSSGHVFSTQGQINLSDKLRTLAEDKAALIGMRADARAKANHFDVSVTESSLLDAVFRQ